jgi:hypothetical protein
VALFGIALPVWCEFYYNNDNRIVLSWASANTMQFGIIAKTVLTTGNWATGGGAIVAGTKYLVEMAYKGGVATLKIGGVLRVTLTGSLELAASPTLAYWGNYNLMTTPSDVVISAT